LERRLRDRGTETEDKINIRLTTAIQELEYGQLAGNFEAILVNDNLEECYDRLVRTLQEWYPDLDLTVGKK
jgi:guanylate kinase